MINSFDRIFFIEQMNFLISIFVRFYLDFSSLIVTVILARCDSASASRPRSRSTTSAGALSVNPGLLVCHLVLSYHPLGFLNCFSSRATSELTSISPAMGTWTSNCPISCVDDAGIGSPTSRKWTSESLASGMINVSRRAKRSRS